MIFTLPKSHNSYNNIIAPEKLQNNGFGSYRLRSEGASVRPSVPPLTAEPSKVFVCVSVISRRMRIIARMQSIGFFNFREIYRKPLHIICEPTVVGQWSCAPCTRETKSLSSCLIFEPTSANAQSKPINADQQIRSMLKDWTKYIPAYRN